MIKRYVVAILLVFLTFTCWSQTYTMMTYNIRYDNPSDGQDRWSHREDEMVKFLEYENPTILGIQEGLHHQVSFLDNNLNGYKYIGVGRDDGLTKGEYCAIFYKADQIKLLESGTFWLSDTPEIISVGWDAALERICTYGLFQDLGTKRQFMVFNTHFDHKGAKARTQSAALIVEKIKEINVDSHPVVLMGDFNATPQEPPIITLDQYMHDAMQLSVKRNGGPKGTINGFRGDAQDRRIDYIFTLNFSVSSYKHVDARTQNNRNLSDHLPVVAELELE